MLTDFLQTVDAVTSSHFYFYFLQGKHFLLRTTAFKYFVQLIFDKSASVLQRLGVFENLKVDVKTGGTFWDQSSVNVLF